MGQADGPGEGDGETRDGSRLCAAVLPTRRPSTMAVHPEPPCEQSAPVPDFSPVPRAGFNGAVASQPRKVDVGAGLGAVAEASMGPWLRSHGRAHGSSPFENRRSSFNGAVASQPRKGNPVWIAARGKGPLQWGRGFAATEGEGDLPPMTSTKTLQWGRGFAATEGCHPQAQLRDPGEASMGPWLRSHGRTKYGQTPTLKCRASMGPWLRSHGRRQPDRRHHARIAQLQWGRGFAATEGRRRRSMRRSCVASMGPWLRSHGRTPKQKAWPASQPGFNGAVASQPRKGTT